MRLSLEQKREIKSKLKKLWNDDIYDNIIVYCLV